MLYFIIIFIVFVSGYSLHAETLDTYDYLTQVFSKNEEFIASEQLQKSYEARADEGSLFYSPRLISHASRAHTESPQLLPYFPIFIAFDEYAKIQVSLGIALIGGLITSTLLTLLVLPAIFRYAYPLHEWAHRLFARSFNPPPKL